MMSQGNFANCMEIIYPFEGRLSRDPTDRGNWTSGKVGVGEMKGTMFGISAMSYPNEDIPNLTKDRANFLYRRDFAPKVAFEYQPAGPNLICLDVAINSGPGRALQFEREALGAKQSSALALATQATHWPDKVGLVKTMCARRSSFYHGIPTFGRNGKGWLRRNAAMEVNGVRMVLSAQEKPADEIKRILEKEESEAQASTKSNGAGAGATGTTSAGTGGHAASQETQKPDLSGVDLTGFDWVFALEVAAIAVLGGLAIWLLWRAVVHHHRKQAYAAAVAGTIIEV